MPLKIFLMLSVTLLMSLSEVSHCCAEEIVPQEKDLVKTDYYTVLVDCNIPSDSLTAYTFNNINDALYYVMIKGSADLTTVYLAPGDYTIKSFNWRNVYLKGLSLNVDEIVIHREDDSDEIIGSDIIVENVTIDDCLYGDRILYRNCKILTSYSCIETETAGRRLYDNCHITCCDESLYGNAVYMNCTFDLYGAMPIYKSVGNGTIFLGSHFNTYFSDVLYLTGEGRVTLVDCDFYGDCAAVFWKNNTCDYDRYYQDGVTLRGEDYTVSLDSLITVDMSGLRLSDAYSFTYKGEKHYNVFNLLCGLDRWDPLQQEKIISEVMSFYGRSFTDLKTELCIEPQSVVIESKDTIISFQAKGFPVIGWNVTDERLRLIPEKDNNMISLKIEAADEDLFTTAMIEVFTDYGLQASSELIICVKGDIKQPKKSEKKRRLFTKNKRVNK